MTVSPFAPPVRDDVLRLGRFSVIAPRRLIVVTGALLALVVALGVLAMTVGTLPLTFGEVLRALFGAPDSAQQGQVVQGLRLPRVLAAVFAGAALGVSGAVFQSVSRNALGSPDVIGFTTGAATGALTQIIVFQAGALQIATGAVLGGLLTAGIVYVLSVKAGVTGGYRLVLVGIGVGAVLGALNGLLLVIGDLDNAIAANLWLSGSLDARNWGHALPVMIGAILVIPLVSALSRRASLMEMGDDLAQQLGIRVERTRILLMIAAVALAGLATGAAGPIAFIALAAPQLAIRLSRVHGVPIFSAAAMGSCLLVGADILTQTLPISAHMPIGRMTGVLGGLYLIWLLTRAKQV